MEVRIRDIMTLLETGDTVPITADTIDIRSQKKYLHHLPRKSVMSIPPFTIARI